MRECFRGTLPILLDGRIQLTLGSSGLKPPCYIYSQDKATNDQVDGWEQVRDDESQTKGSRDLAPGKGSRLPTNHADLAGQRCPYELSDVPAGQFRS